MSKSVAEEVFAIAWRRLMPFQPAPVTQLKFHPVRKWLFDFAWPDLLVAVEIQGAGKRGNKGGHQTHEGMQNDCDKNNAALELGWRLIYFRAGDRARAAHWCAVVARVMQQAEAHPRRA